MAKLFTKSILDKLIKNGKSLKENHVPVVKVFTPDANCTWLFTEYDEQNGVLFGLCDLGFGSPELGYVDLNELTELRGKLGLPVERDRYTTFDKTIQEYAEIASQNGYIVA